MGRPEKEMSCKRHPYHNNIYGVCPYCVRHRLENLPATSASSTADTSISTSASSYSAYSSYESESSSSSSSPRPERRGRSRLLQLLKGRKKKEMRSSKSFSFSEEKEKEKDNNSSHVKKAGGVGKIFAKLGMVGVTKILLTHSKTVREQKSSSKWKIFS